MSGLEKFVVGLFIVTALMLGCGGASGTWAGAGAYHECIARGVRVRVGKGPLMLPWTRR